jgi:hypothetical protein
MKKWIEHNWGLFAGLVVCVGLLVWVYGCETTVPSLKYPEKKVTINQLEVEYKEITGTIETELERLESEFELSKEHIRKIDTLKENLFTVGVEMAETGVFNPTKIFAVIASAIGIGALADNRRKDTYIEVVRKKEKLLNMEGGKAYGLTMKIVVFLQDSPRLWPDWAGAILRRNKNE